MKNFLHVYRFGEELAKEGFNVVYPIKVTDTNWLSMLGISRPEQLSIEDVKSYHFQKPIKAYTPQDVMTKLRDNVSAYAIRINSKMDIKELRTADNEEHIELSWYDMYRRKHLWPKTNIKINLHNIIIDVMAEVYKAEWYFSQQDHYCPYCGTICTNQLRPYKKEEHWQDNVSYEEAIKLGWAKHALTGELLSKKEYGTNGKARLVQNLICEGIGCTYKKVKTRVMLSPDDKRKQILPRVVKEYYYYEGKKVKELDYLDE
tara:strand:+ start:1128 stop:1907 length:780 start_codon:yes stop_codon:yes gene_type:complete